MPRDDLDDILAALALPPRARARWLDDLERFCRAHGGERHYRELMALVRECKQRTEPVRRSRRRRTGEVVQ